MLYTSETCCKYSKTHFLTFIFSVFFYLPLEKIIGELCWVRDEQKTFGKIKVNTEL